MQEELSINPKIMIEIENKKIYDLITLKDTLVDEGRAITILIEKEEKKIKSCEDKEKRITGNVKPDKVLTDEGDALIIIFNKTLKRIEELGQLVEQKKLDAVPKELKDEHQISMKEKERLERERNKIALKIQKVKDRVIPLIQKNVKPMLKEYDDIETAKTKNGKVIVETFNHLADWKSKFNR